MERVATAATLRDARGAGVVGMRSLAGRLEAGLA